MRNMLPHTIQLGEYKEVAFLEGEIRFSLSS
jgi:hypothetical protein